MPRFSVAWMLAGPGAVGGALAQLQAATALERRLLFECDLELVEALSHAQIVTSNVLRAMTRAAHRELTAASYMVGPANETLSESDAIPRLARRAVGIGVLVLDREIDLLAEDGDVARGGDPKPDLVA